MQKRVYNFSAGPAVLPLRALEEAQRELLALPGVGSSILEISHRSKTFITIIEQAEANLRQLLNVPDNYRVLFLQGGAQMQFGMIPMNFLRQTGRSADYLLTGTWGRKARKEAETQGKVRLAFDGESTRWTRVPTSAELDVDSNAAYIHMTSNETIQGVQFATEPEVGDVPLVCDSSSDILSRPVSIEKYAILYACAQKNAGPAGVTLVIMRDDMIKQCPSDLPSMLNYRVHDTGNSLANTPPVFSIYIVKLVTDWLLCEGGLEKIYPLNRQKAELLYDVIDRSDGFYEPHAESSSRSLMNVTFRLADSSLDDQFTSEAAKCDLVALKGHRSVGGFRASIYNAMPIEGVQRLRDFMLEFADRASRKSKNE